MIFLHSRKTPFFLFVIWLISVIVMYMLSTSATPYTSNLFKEKVEQTTYFPQKKVPQKPRMNRLLDTKITSFKSNPQVLLIHLNYETTDEHAFTIDKIRNYHIKNSSFHVIELGAPWEHEISQPEIESPMAPIKNAKLIVTDTNQLRLILQTRKKQAAKYVKMVTNPTETGILVRVTFLA